MMDSLTQQIDEIEKLIPEHERVNPAVSKASMGWQIAHTLLVIKTVVTALERSDPAHYKWKPNLLRPILLTLRYFPRGKGRAPKVARPEDLRPEALTAQLAETREMLKILSAMPPGKYFKHPYFGNIKVNKTEKFLRVHTHHHLKIMREINT